MNKEKLKWLVILVVSVLSLVGYGLFNSQIVFGEKMEVEKLEIRVNDYISRINPNLVISDIFVYSDSDYYFSIEEASTGRGAMELLVNPYTGRIRPEYGPNMMWNDKYGMHSGRFSMMGGNNNYYYSENTTVTEITRSEALTLANAYIQISHSSYLVIDEGHAFYGYFTFHVEEQGSIVGMIGVNAYSGDVWFHDWHGNLIEVRSSHD